MADILLLLGKLNVAMGAAIIVVCLLRRPLRTLFGASIAYAIWLLVPVAGLAILLPPRTIAALPPAPLTSLQFAPVSLLNQIARPAARMTEQLAGHSAPLHPMIAHPLIAAGAATPDFGMPDFGMPDYALLIFVAWIFGAVLMASYLARLQMRFHAAVRLGEAGPAVLGFFRPRVVIPDSFQEQFTTPEQEAILAHERVHLVRQDARINALAALLRCLCWFNPLIHLGAAWLRTDQELACDATTVAGPVSRRDYANALMKSQMMIATLPLGCNWPGSPHPLIERIALLKRKRPGTARRIAGTGLVILAATSTGLGAWAAQPPVAANSSAGPQSGNRIASARIASAQISSTKPPAMTATPDRDVTTAGPSQPVTSANPTRGTEAVSLPHISRLLPTGILAARQPDVSALLPVMPQLIASNDPPTAPIQQTLASAAPQIATAQARTCALPTVADKVDLRKLPGSDLMTVPVEINGTQKQFLLDFDGDPTEISEPMAAELHLPNIDRSAAAKAMAGPNALHALFFDVKGAGTAKDYQARVRVASLTMGDATLHDMQFLIADDRDLGKSEPYDGRLTRSDFPQYDVDFDFGGRALSFLTPTSCADPDQVAYWPHASVAVVPMTLSGGKMQVQVMIQGHVIDAVIDTGSPRTVMRRDIAELILGLKADTPEMMPAGDLKDGAGMQIYAHTFPQISFGGVIANNVPALIQANSMIHKMDRTPILGSRAQFAADPGERIPDLALGMDVLHQLHLYAAFDQNKLYVTPAGNKPYLLSAE